MRVDPPPVERRPLPVGAERQVGHQHVRVQLRIAGARGPMPERRRHEPVARDRVHPGRPAPRHRRCALHVAQRIQHRPVVRVAQHRAQRVVADAEQHAHALRRRERQIKARPSGREYPAERRHRSRDARPAAPGRGRSRPTLPLSPSAAAAGARPHAGGLRAAEVVVLDAGAHGRRARQRAVGLLEVVAGLAGRELSEREHDDLHPSSRQDEVSGHLPVDGQREPAGRSEGQPGQDQCSSKPHETSKLTTSGANARSGPQQPSKVKTSRAAKAKTS